MQLSPNALATVLLVAHIDVGEAKPFKVNEFRKLLELFPEPGKLLGKTHSELQANGLSKIQADRVLNCLDRATGIAFALERFHEMGVEPITRFDEQYPTNFIKKLGTSAPSLIFTSGSTQLLNRTGIGVVGSRNVNEEGHKITQNFAKEAVNLNIPVISGGARGVDQAAMRSAEEHGGFVIAALANSLVKSIQSAEVRKLIFDERAVFLTPYNPEAGFTVGNAMGRNKLIYALAETTVVVSSDKGSGGTWTGAVEALEKNFGHVSVWSGKGEGPGNKDLIEKGARELSSVSQLKDAVESAGEAGTKRETFEQANIFANPTTD